MAQAANKNIDNASGQVVRLDIQNTIKAVATHNFGARNDAGTILPCEFLADDTTNKLLIRKSSGGDQANPNPTSGTAADFFPVGNLDEDNLGLLPKAGGTMTGPLLVDDASGAGAPAIAFDGDADTGIFRVGSNTIGFATAGVERVEISDAGLDMSNGLPIRFQDSSGAPFVALKSPASVSSNVTFTLPGADGSNGQMLQTNGSGALSFTTVQGVPTGSVFCMAVATVPSGYLECNGAAVSRTTYAALFAIIGVQYGAGNGSSTFNIPDLRGEFVRGFDNGKGTDNNRQIASSQSASNASHNHSISLSGTTSTKSLTGGIRKISEGFNANGSASGVFTKTQDGTNSITESASTSPVGGVNFDGSHNHTFSASGTSGSQGGEARPRNIAMMYIIKI